MSRQAFTLAQKVLLSVHLGKIDIPFRLNLLCHTPMENRPSPQWYSLSYAISFMFRRKQLLLWSIFLFLITIGLTTLGYLLTTGYFDTLLGNFLVTPPDAGTIWGWIKHKGWLILKWFFLIVSRIIAFYFAFLLAYCLTSPGYVFLSTAAEQFHAGERFDTNAGLSLSGVLIDLFEGVKIGLFGLLVTVAALAVNFIPGIGQVALFLLYTYYSALMFIDFPASRRRWSLGRKISWLRDHGSPAFRLGILPALISMVPLLNIFFMSLLFPVLTIQTTLNFSAIELAEKGVVPKTPARDLSTAQPNDKKRI
jgi:CysZ protein